MSPESKDRAGAAKSGAQTAYSLEPTLTVIGLTTQGRFFREKVAYTLEEDGFHFHSKQDVAAQASILLEVESADRGAAPSKIRAKIAEICDRDRLAIPPQCIDSVVSNFIVALTPEP